MIKKLLFSLIILLLLSGCSKTKAKRQHWLALSRNSWHIISPGLALGKWDLEPDLPEPELIALRFNPEFYRFDLLAASMFENRRLSARKWQKKFHKTAIINAAMFAEDVLTSTSYFRNGRFINNDQFSDYYLMAFVCEPLDPALPSARLIDLHNEDTDLLKKYRQVVCGMRMLSSDAENVWLDKTEKWNEAALAMDEDGRIYWLLSLKKYFNYEFIDLCRKMPFNLQYMMHLDGGSPASMFLENDSLLINIIAGNDVSPRNLRSIFQTHKLPLVLTCSPR
ncbi:MAG: hypothetical protein K9N06_06500 [Candidatus Cloacimonetes bacterium]|nr:hypothetical protein [Candidatus Cloacimonadota bacterium]